jgi:hypothetical protein
MTETSTVSTIAASARLRKSFPPPNSQMSFPGLAFRSAKASIPFTTATSGWSSAHSVVDTMIVFMPQASKCGPRGCHGLKRTAPGEDRVELLEQSTEIEIRIRLDPVKFSLRPSDVTIKTHGNRISYAPH